MHRVNNFAIVFAVVKRCLSDSSFKGNEHYTFSVRHVKTEVNNHSYIVKKTTAIPKEISYFSAINYGDILPKKLELESFYNNANLYPSNHSRFKMRDDVAIKFHEETLYLQDLINKLISPHHLKESRNYNSDVCFNKTLHPLSSHVNSSGNQIANQNDGDLSMKENTNSQFVISYENKNCEDETLGEQTDSSFSNSIIETDKENIIPDYNYSLNKKQRNSTYVNLTEVDQLSLNHHNHTSIIDDCDANQLKHIDGFSSTKIIELVSKKIIDSLCNNLKPNGVSSEYIILLNPKIPNKTTFVYFKDKGLHVIESPHIKFHHEIKDYIKNLDEVEGKGKQIERINFIRFYKVSPLSNCFDEILSNNYSSSSFLPVSLDDVSELCSTIDSSSSTNLDEGFHNIILKVQESTSLENKSEKLWIPYEEEHIDNLNQRSINCEETVKKISNEENECVLSWDHKGLSSKSIPPITDKVPINKDKLIEETVVPNTSILNIINSIDKSAVIIQKDLYITDQIIQKIQKDEEKQKQKVTDKNKLESSQTKKGPILYIGSQFVKDGKITLPLSDLTHRLFFRCSQPEIAVESTNSNSTDTEWFLNNIKNRKRNENSACLERQNHSAVNTAQHSNLSELQQINESNKNASETLENFDFQKSEKKSSNGEIILTKQKDNVDDNYIQENKSNIQGKINKNYITEKNENKHKLEINKNEQNTSILSSKLVDIASCKSEWTKLPSNDNMIMNNPQSNENNIQIYNQFTSNNKEEGNEVSDMGVFLKIESVDDNGNMIFNLTNKSGKFISMLSLHSKEKDTCKQNLVHGHIKTNNKNEVLAATTLQMCEARNTSNLERCDPKNNSYQPVTKDKHNDSNVYALDKFHKKIYPVQKLSSKINETLPRIKFEGHGVEKLLTSENPYKKPNTAQYSIKDGSNCSQLKPIESQDNKELNECLNKTTKLIGYGPPKVVDSELTNSKHSEITKYSFKSSHSHPFTKENIKKFPYRYIDGNPKKQKVDLHSKNNPSEIKCNLNSLYNNTYLEKEVEEDSKHLETKLPVPIKSNMLSTVKDNSTECLMKGRSNDGKKQNIDIPKRKKLESSTTNSSSNKSVDHIKKTTISSIKKNNFTDIRVSEVETFVDSRLPVPFSTETFFQIFGSNSSLRDHSTLIDAAKYKLTTPNKAVGYPTSMDVMEKLDVIQKSVEKLNIPNVYPELLKSKGANVTTKSLVPAKEISKGSVNKQIAIQDNFDKDTQRENFPYKHKIIGAKRKVANYIEKLSLKTNKQSNLPVKTTSSKEINKNKFKRFNVNSRFEIKRQDNKTSLDQEKKKLLVLNKKNKTTKLKERSKENMKGQKINQIKSSTSKRKPASVGAKKIVTGNYIDLFNFHKSGKDKKKLMFSNPKKSIYNHKGLSKRDKKILREIAKEIPKQKSNRSRSRRRPMKSITSKKTEKEVLKQTSKTEPKPQHLGRHPKKTSDSSIKLPVKTNIISNKNSELVAKTNINNSNTYSENKKKLLPKGIQENPKMREVNQVENLQKNKIQNITSLKSLKAKNKTVSDFKKSVKPKSPYPAKQSNRPHKALPEVTNEPTKNSTSLRPLNKVIMDKQSTNGEERNKNPDAKLIAGERLSIKKIDNYRKIINKKLPQKTAELQNIKIQGHDEKLNDEKYNKKPLCHTYIATEAYINQPEKSKTIPDESFTFPKLTKTLENNPPPIPQEQKVTIVEKYNKAAKDEYLDNSKIQEDFKKELIKKSQEKIEHKSNIDYRVKTPKIKNAPSKQTVLKSNINKSKMSPISGAGKTPLIKKEVKKKSSDIKSKSLKQTGYVKNKVNNKHLKAMPQTSPKAMMTKLSPTVNIVKKESSKNDSLNQNSGIPIKEVLGGNEKPDQIAASKYDDFNKMSSEPKSKINELQITKSSEKPSEGREKSPDNQEQLRMTPIENKTSDQRLPRKTVIVPSENKKNFPMLLIDVDKMSKEIKPELDLKNCQKCSVTTERIIDFPLLNPKKKLIFTHPARVLNLGPSRDPMLRKELNFFPSVTKILNSTIPEDEREILRQWRRGMIDELGENGFKLFYKGQLTNGSKFHSQLHNHLLNVVGGQDDSSHLSMKSIRNVLKRLTHLSAVNSHVVHRKLAYRGVIDCVAKYQNNPFLIEWKRLENPQAKVADLSFNMASIQLSAYIGAVNYDDTYKFQLSGGLIVVAYDDGSEAEVLEINKDQCLKYWKKWLKKVQLFHESLHKKQN